MSKLQKFPAVLLFFLWSFTLFLFIKRILWIFSFKYPISTDGFYYLIEFRSYLDSGTGYFTKASIFFLTFTNLFRVVIKSPEYMFQCTLVLILLLYIISFFVVARRSLIAGSSASLFFISSDLIFYRIYAFPVQYFSTVLLFLGIGIILYPRNVYHLKMRYLGFFIFFLGMFSHTLIFFLCCLLIVPLFFFSRRVITKKAGDNFFNGTITAFIFALLFCLCFALFKLKRNTDHVFNFNLRTFNIHELGFFKTCSYMQCSHFEYFEMYTYIVISLLLTALGMYIHYKKKLTHKNSDIQEQHAYISTVIALTLVVILFNIPIWDTKGHVLYRGVSLLYVLLIYAVLFITFSDFFEKKVTRYSLQSAATCIFILIPLVSLFLQKREYKDKLIEPYLLTKKGSLIKEYVGNNGIVIAEHGNQFRVTYLLQIKAKQLPQENLSSARNFYSKENTYYELVKGTSCIDKIERIVQERSCVGLGNTWSLWRVKK
jgi:hypothetical protein